LDQVSAATAKQRQERAARIEIGPRYSTPTCAVALLLCPDESEKLRRLAPHTGTGEFHVQEVLLGKQFSLTSNDKFQLGAYRADPSGPTKGGIVVIQEIFGVNHHIRAVCDRLAGDGYAAVAPALFDRQVKDFQSGYTPDEIAEARKFVANPDWGAMLRDTQAAIDELKSSGPVAIMGFCMGGTIAFLAACRLNGLSAAVCYYGGQIAKNADEKPKIPTLMHFGEQDASIPMSDVETVKKKRGGDSEIYVYPGAAHGFHCDERGSFHEASAKLAWQRSMEFLQKHLKK
jgi:carboxymethylenebutenolidase